MAGSQRGDKRGCFGSKGRSRSKVTWKPGSRTRGARVCVSGRENLFIVGGVVFIFFTIPLLAIWDVKHDPARSPEGIAAARAEDLKVGEWYASAGPRNKSSVPVSWLLRRNAMIQSVSVFQPKDFDDDCLRWVVHSLENRPSNYRYDLRCINLLGRLRAHLKYSDKISAKELFDKP